MASKKKVNIEISRGKYVESKNLKKLGFKREICFLAVHGFLHLLGYDHMEKEDEVIMFSKQELILNEAGIKK